MKTAPYKQPSTDAFNKGGLSTTQEFLVFSADKGKTQPLIDALYATVWSLRAKLDVKVYFSQGDLIFHHDGQNFVAGTKDFVEALQSFEACLVADYRLGVKDALAARDAEQAKSQRSKPQGVPVAAPTETEGASLVASSPVSESSQAGSASESQEYRQGRRRR